MATVSEALAIAVQHHQAGRLQAAGQIYRQILQAEPTHADALHLLGVVSAQRGNRDAAVELIRRALTVRPRWPEALANLGNALREQGELDEAAQCLQRSLELKPDHAAAHNNLGNTLKDQGNLDHAIACYGRAIELKPDFVDAHNNLGNALKDQGSLDLAIACYRRAIELKPDYAPPVSALPALENQYVTFGSFNNPAKIGPQVLEVWARILRRCPQARLVLKYKGMDDPTLTGRLAEIIADDGIDPRRAAFLGKSSHPELLAHYHGIDIGLDPFPYNGGLTTCEALWMRVPVITCPGETFAGRHSLTHLSNVGLTQTIAHDWDEHVELAVSLANDLPGLAAVRAELRDRMAASPLCDGKRFAADLMSVSDDVWKRHGG
jgi:predicted O-linked N-acetylglucosamine transferase (SPINDLY family)